MRRSRLVASVVATVVVEAPRVRFANAVPVRAGRGGYPERMRRRTVTSLAAVLVAVGLAGCAVQSSTPVTDLEARERFLAVLDETQGVVGGSWQTMDDPTPRECVIPLWVAGERYPALRVGEAPASVGAAADRVEAAWAEAGMRVTRTAIGDVVEVRGESAEGEVVVLRVSESASTLLGESECRPL